MPKAEPEPPHHARTVARAKSRPSPPDKRKSTPPPKRAPAKRDARQRILAAATDLFTTTTFSDLSVEQIAQRAGVAHGLVFHYFGNKARLYEEVSQGAADRLDETHRQGTTDGADPSGKVAGFLECHLRAVEARKADFVFHSRGGATPAIQAIWERSRRNAILLVLSFFGIADPSEALIVTMRAWLGFYDELVLAWIQGAPIPRAGVIEASRQLLAAVLQQAHLLGANDAPAAAGSTAN